MGRPASKAISGSSGVYPSAKPAGNSANRPRSISSGLYQVEVVQTFDKIALSGSAGNGRVQRRIQNHLGLLERRQLMKVAQELEESYVPRQIRFADASKHAPVRLEQGEQALCPVLMHVTPRVFLL